MTDFAQFEQSPAEKATYQAEYLVEQFVQRDGQTELRFQVGLEDAKALTHLPWNITHATQVRFVAIPGTGVRDIRPLTALANLQALDIRDSEVEDLRPILEMPYLYRDASSPTPIQSPAFQFTGCKATKFDPKLKELSEIEDDQQRFIETVRYLAKLPAYPALLPHQEVSFLTEMKEDISEYSEVTSEEAAQQRALVYGALFRPGSDGTVKDDGGLDPAISAAVSKLLSR